MLTEENIQLRASSVQLAVVRAKPYCDYWYREGEPDLSAARNTSSHYCLTNCYKLRLVRDYPQHS